MTRECGEKEIKKGILHKKLCNAHHQLCGAGGVSVVVMVCDD